LCIKKKASAKTNILERMKKMGKFTLGLGTAWRRGRAMARRRSNILAASLGLLAQWLPSPIAGPPSLYTGGEGAIFFILSSCIGG